MEGAAPDFFNTPFVVGDGLSHWGEIRLARSGYPWPSHLSLKEMVPLRADALKVVLCKTRP